MSVRVTSVFVVTLMLIVGSGVVGQEPSGKPLGIFADREEANRFFGELKQLQDPEINAVLPVMYDAVMGNPFGTTSSKIAGGSLLPQLVNPKIRHELEIAEEQYEQLLKTQERFQRELREQLDGGAIADPNRVLEVVRDLQSTAEKEMRDILLPHQIERLEQRSAQGRVKQGSLAKVLTSEPLRSRLEISERQAEELLQSEEELEAELEREIARLRERAREKFLSGLDVKQREEVERIFGEMWKRSDAPSKR